MRSVRTIFLSLCLWFSPSQCCLARRSLRYALNPRRSDIPSFRPVTIPRGGSGGSFPVSLDQVTVAKVGLTCLLAQCAVDIAIPSAVVEAYGLDTSQEINSFYFSRIGGLGLTAVGSLTLQIFANMSFSQAIGVAFIPIALLTLYQLLAGKYDKAGVSRNNGIVALFFQTVHCAITLAGGKIPSSVTRLWIQVFMILMGLSGLNLVISAQTIPGISLSTTATLRMLGTVSCYVATSSISQQVQLLDAVKAFGALMAALALTSIPVCMDLVSASRSPAVGGKTSTLKTFRSAQLYIIFIFLEIGVAAYMFR